MATRADRLNRCIAALGPEMAKMVREGWGPAGAPYSISQREDGRWRVVIVDRITGDPTGASGATMEDAIAALEAKMLKPEDQASAGGA